MSKSLASILALIAVCLAFGASARADTLIGIQAIAISGTHFQPKGNVAGTGFGGVIELDQRWRSVQLHVEGFPSVGTATVNTARGPVRSSIGRFSAAARFRIDRAGRLWAGIGAEVLAQQTPQGRRCEN